MFCLSGSKSIIIPPSSVAIATESGLSMEIDNSSCSGISSVPAMGVAGLSLSIAT